VAGTRCTAGRCLPRTIEPTCWFDTDCGEGRRCRFATCFGGAR
jgi:hypothetical protein